jgi:hypothetical protein
VQTTSRAAVDMWRLLVLHRCSGSTDLTLLRPRVSRNEVSVQGHVRGGTTAERVLALLTEVPPIPAGRPVRRG